MRYDGATFATFAVRRKQNEEFTTNKSTSRARPARESKKKDAERSLTRELQRKANRPAQKE